MADLFWVVLRSNTGRAPPKTGLPYSARQLGLSKVFVLGGMGLVNIFSMKLSCFSCQINTKNNGRFDYLESQESHDLWEEFHSNFVDPDA
ncbi:hypothetical protein RchiOBHm_Chr1g0358741 [Rosa chinensis]|uniref:Uncharacterized protein n=1 Tax=Rosa chinensis TaxID=74649 RepID=A0A2P6SI78_ROSCH|nr:hypothetical protein RchiOBHm_Chr1g0358741 [Rosa chinensis]